MFRSGTLRLRWAVVTQAQPPMPANRSREAPPGRRRRDQASSIEPDLCSSSSAYYSVTSCPGRLRGEAAFTVHRFPAEGGRFYYSTQLLVVVGREGVTAVLLVGREGEIG